MARFLDFIASPANSLLAGLVEVLVDSGGRRSEVLALRWQDIDLDAPAQPRLPDSSSPMAPQKTVTARPTKRPRSKSTIGLHLTAVAALRRRRAEQASSA